MMGPSDVRERKLRLAARARGILAMMAELNSLDPSLAAELATELPPGCVGALKALAVPEGQVPSDGAVLAARGKLGPDGDF